MRRRCVMACLGLLAAAAATAQQATLTLSREVALWDDRIEARIEGLGCGGTTAAPSVSVSSAAVWTIDIDLLGCQAGGQQPFSASVELGPLFPRQYTVRVRVAGAPSGAAPLDTATLSVHRDASLEVELPAVATDEAPVPIVLRGLASSACFFIEGPNVGDRVIEAFFDDSCAILPPGGPNAFAEQFLVGPLAAGTYEIRFFQLGGPGELPSLHRQTLLVHDADRCVPADTALCLQAGRFRVEATWRDFAQRQGVAHAIPLTDRDDSGLLWFFGPENVELTVKILDGCGHNGHWWVFVSSGSTVAYTVTVTDTISGAEHTYPNALGQAAPLVHDTEAFACP